MPDYWLTPPEIYQALDGRFHFDFDPFPFPRPEGWNALKAPWGRMNYVNPPFNANAGSELNLCVRKAILEARQGNDSVIVFPCNPSHRDLWQAGARLILAADVQWHSTADGSPNPHPRPSMFWHLTAWPPRSTQVNPDGPPDGNPPRS